MKNLLLQIIGIRAACDAGLISIGTRDGLIEMIQNEIKSLPIKGA
jgi:hypothetical protein